MPYLDAALAFALTMLVISTAISQIVKLLRNTASLRNEVMKEMLADYYRDEIKQVVHRELNRLTGELKKGVARELKTGIDTVFENLHAKNDNFTPALFTDKELEDLVSASTEEIKERLKRSELGSQLLIDLGDKAQGIFDELGKRYEFVGKRFTESFRVNSRNWAIGVALVLALVVNIDSIHIANTYITSEGARDTVIAQKDAFVQDYNDLVKALETENKDSVTKQELEQAFSDSQEQLNVLTSAGFPIGWSYFPHALFIGDNGASQAVQARNTPLGIFTWILGILLTAGLAGLGTPFWYDVVAGISRSVRSIQSPRDPEG